MSLEKINNNLIDKEGEISEQSTFFSKQEASKHFENKTTEKIEKFASEKFNIKGKLINSTNGIINIIAFNIFKNKLNK